MAGASRHSLRPKNTLSCIRPPSQGQHLSIKRSQLNPLLVWKSSAHGELQGLQKRSAIVQNGGTSLSSEGDCRLCFFADGQNLCAAPDNKAPKIAKLLAAYQMQHRSALDVVLLGSLVIIHLLASKNQPAQSYSLRCSITNPMMLSYVLCPFNNSPFNESMPNDKTTQVRLAEHSPLLHWWDALLLFYTFLDTLNRITWLNVNLDLFASQGFHLDHHSAPAQNTDPVTRCFDTYA